MRLKRLSKNDDLPQASPEKAEAPAEPAIIEAKPDTSALIASEAGADPAAMTASKKRRRRRHRSRKPAQAIEGTSMSGSEAVMDEAVPGKTMMPANQLPVATPTAQKAATTQTHPVITAETGKAAANTASGPTEGTRKASSQQTRRPRAGSQNAAKKAQKPADTAGLKQEAPDSKPQ